MDSTRKSEPLTKLLEQFAKLVKYGTPKQLSTELSIINDNTLLTLPLSEINETALHLAARYNPSAIPILLKFGANPLIVTIDGNSALDYMFMRDPIDFHLCSMMIQHGANIFTKNNDGENIFDLAIREAFKFNNMNKKNEVIKFAVSLISDIATSNNDIALKTLDKKYDDIVKTQNRLDHQITNISAYLEHLIKTMPNKIDCNNLFTLKKEKIPKISIKNYLAQLALYLDPITSFNPITAIYFTAMLSTLELYLQKSKSQLTTSNIHCLLLTSFTIVYKYIKDAGHAGMSEIADAGGIPVRDLLRIERDFLKIIDYIIPINIAEIQKCRERIQRDGIRANLDNINFSQTFFSHNQDQASVKEILMRTVLRISK